MPLSYIRTHARKVIAIGAISALLGGGGAFTTYSLISGQEDATKVSNQAAQRAYEAERDAYNSAQLLRAAQVDACKRANKVRKELNDQLRSEMRQRDIFLHALSIAAGGDSQIARQFAVLRDSLRDVVYKPVAVPNCELIVPKVQQAPPVPPKGVVSEGVLLGKGVAVTAAATVSRATKVKRVLHAHYGSICQSDVYRIPLVRVDGLRNPRNGERVDGLAIMNRYPDPTRCIIYIERARYSTETLCILWAHELGHFRYGPGHNPERDGRLMTPYLPEQWGPCTRRFGD